MSGMSGEVPRSYADQLAILEGRGLSVVDKAEALHWLSAHEQRVLATTKGSGNDDVD